MKRWFCLCLLFCIIINGVSVNAEDDNAKDRTDRYGFLVDDCVDFSASVSHSDGVYADVTPEEDRYAFDDFTTFMRNDSTAEWVEYAIPDYQYLVFHTYFKENEPISDFSFSWSADRKVWNKFIPAVKIENVESWRWKPVIYSLKNIDSSAKYVRITFGNVGGTVWSPRIAGVYSRYINESELGFVDCTGTEYYDATAVLKALGILSGKNNYEFKPDSAVTRAEFAQFTASLLRLDTSRTNNCFKDVFNDYWSAGAISALYDTGILNGDENGYFFPEDTVTFSEAIKILVSALGYSEVAAEKGGYPTGFLAIANQLGLTDGMKFSSDAGVVRGMAAMMIYNALDAPLLYRLGFGTDSARYDNRNFTVLDCYHNISKISGLLTDTGVLSVISDHSFSDKIAVIDDTKLTVSDYLPADLLGQRVDAYVKYSDNAEYGELIYAVASAGTTLLDIPYTKYDRTDNGYIYFEDQNGKENRCAFSNNTRVVYNGRYETRMGMISEPDFSCGFMRIIKNSGSSAADTIIIDDYQTYHIAAGGSINKPLTDKTLGKVDLISENAEKIDIIYYGESIPYNEDILINSDAIVNLARSKDGKVVKLYITNEKISGTLSMFNPERRICVLDGETLNCSKNLSDISNYIGKSVVVYKDINGSAAAIEAAGLQNKYGYFLGISAEDNLSGNLRIKMLTCEGDKAEYIMNKSTKLDGNKSSVGTAAGIFPQLVRYSVREDNTLITLDTAMSNTKPNGEEFTKNFSSDSCKYYGGQMKLFASVYQLTDDTRIFIVPKDRNDIEGYKIKNIGYFITDKSYSVELFDTDDTYKVKAAVVYLDKSEERRLEYSDSVAVIKDYWNINDKDGRSCIDLLVDINGEENHIYFDNDGGVDLTGDWLPEHYTLNTANGQIPFKKGDVLQYYMDDESHCRYFRMLLTSDFLNNGLEYEKNFGDYGRLTSENYFSELYSALGTVSSRFSDKFILSVGENLRSVMLNNTVVYRLDSAKNKLYKCDKSDISIGDTVFVRINFADTKEIIIIDR